jgi:hypothetical protein
VERAHGTSGVGGLGSSGNHDSGLLELGPNRGCSRLLHGWDRVEKHQGKRRALTQLRPKWYAASGASSGACSMITVIIDEREWEA